MRTMKTALENKQVECRAANAAMLLHLPLFLYEKKFFRRNLWNLPKKYCIINSGIAECVIISFRKDVRIFILIGTGEGSI